MSELFEFNAKEFLGMSSGERVRACQRLARRAQELAQTGEPGYRASYAEIASQWLRLADEVARQP